MIESLLPFSLPKRLDFKGFSAFQGIKQPVLESFPGRVFLFSAVAADCRKSIGLLCGVFVCFLSKGLLYRVIVCFSSGQSSFLQITLIRAFLSSTIPIIPILSFVQMEFFFRKPLVERSI